MNKHLPHIEELILIHGMAGAEATNQFFWKLVTGEAKVSAKIDGSPAIVCGTDPKDDKFFVSTKSFFNKTPVMYKSQDDINHIENIGLRNKIRFSLSYLQELKFDGYLQGDLLFDPDSLVYNCESDWFLAQPNTLIYGFECDYEFGIAFHTHYDYNMKISYDYDFSLLKHPNPNVILMDTSVTPYIPDLDWSQSFEQYTLLNKSFVDLLKNNPHMGSLMMQFFNSKIRAGISIDHVEMLDEIEQWIYRYFNREIDKRSSTIGKQTQRNALWGCMSFFTPTSKPYLRQVLRFIQSVDVLKKNCINRLDKQSKMKIWTKNKDGYQPASHEGYVVSDGSDACKFVDREKFSFFNFSHDFVKGWDTPTRT